MIQGTPPDVEESWSRQSPVWVALCSQLNSQWRHFKFQVRGEKEGVQQSTASGKCLYTTELKESQNWIAYIFKREVEQNNSFISVVGFGQYSVHLAQTACRVAKPNSPLTPLSVCGCLLNICTMSNKPSLIYSLPSSPSIFISLGMQGTLAGVKPSCLGSSPHSHTSPHQSPPVQQSLVKVALVERHLIGLCLIGVN